MMQLLCNFFFIIRRLILVLAAIFLSDYPAIQALIYNVLSQLNLLYLIKYQPFKGALTQRIEIFNELCILLASLQFFCYTDFLAQADMKTFLGYWLIATVFLNFTVNIVVQIGATLAMLPRLLRKCRAMLRKYKLIRIARKQAIHPSHKVDKTSN